MKAYDAILRFYHYEAVLTVKAFETAREALEQAVEIDPEWENKKYRSIFFTANIHSYSFSIFGGNTAEDFGSLLAHHPHDVS